MELSGVTGSPYNTPRTRRALPKPFVRPSIDISGTAKLIKRVWRELNVLDVKPGDTVAGVGVVANCIETRDFSNPKAPVWSIRLHNVAHDYFDFGGHERVFAFAPEVPVDAAG